MENLLENIPHILLMGPGPSYVPESIYQALRKPTLGHLDPYFFTIIDGLKENLKTLLKTKNEATFPISGTGFAGMEACVSNLTEAGDAILIIINGIFGKKMSEMATRLGAKVDVLEFEWGTPVLVDKVKEQLAQKAYKVVGVIHAETSTGVRNPVPEIGQLLKGTDTIFLVDAVTSLGGLNVPMNEWNIDALYSGTQKCLSCPPGLSPVSFSEKAMSVVKSRKTPIVNWYFDVTLLRQYWDSGVTRGYHHTPPINMLYGLYQALYNILEEGMENVYARHLENHHALVAGLEKMGLEMLVAPEHRLPMLNAVKIPAGIDDAAARRTLLNEHQIEIGGGLGPLAGKIWRIGLMGHTSRPENVARVLDALKQTLKR